MGTSYYMDVGDRHNLRCGAETRDSTRGLSKPRFAHTGRSIERQIRLLGQPAGDVTREQANTHRSKGQRGLVQTGGLAK